ncbi:MAG: VOC family protein, partial [Planctomycetota bacterium]
SADPDAARAFWVEALGLSLLEQEPGGDFIVDAGGLRLCIDYREAGMETPRRTDPVIGLKVQDVAAVLSGLERSGVRAERGPERGRRGRWALIRDPDGHAVVLTEAD